MKIEELEIGDWVSSNGESYQIDQVIDGEANLVWIVPKRGLCCIRLCKLDPILITPSILRRNGYLLYDGGADCVRESNGDVNILIYGDGYMELRIDSQNVKLSMPIKYIHELQHAMRLCKIKKDIKL